MKLQELRDLTIEELEAKVISLRKELFDLRIKKATYKLDNTSEISKKRRIIAQIKTVVKQKHLQLAK
ncbi:MAG TPA: 50S ribosomal protein L29 [Cyanobacteria bacterium UBA9971]|nr:50S ribosomal protein L29 [Cyanobacteria bacterium UBA9971]